MDVDPISQRYGGGIPDFPLSQEVLEENEKLEEEWLGVPTSRKITQDDDDTEPQVEAGDVPIALDEEKPESDNSTNGEDEDPAPPSEIEQEVISGWAWIGGAMRMAQKEDEAV
jgi:hypothetical protein